MTDRNNTSIHSTAIIEEGAKIGAHVTIGPYAIIHKDCILEDHVTIKGHAYIDGHTTIGEASTVWPGAVVGTQTQDLKFRGEKTYVHIGKRCQIRECATINASCGEGTEVRIGDDCLIMAYCHVAHNCLLGKGVIMVNQAALAGHVTVEDKAVIGGLVAVHQYCRIGAHAMIGGMSRITYDVAPYTVGAGVPYRLGGLNLVGLKRHGFSLEKRKLLTQAFRLVFWSELPLQESLARLETLEPIPEIVHFIEFCKTTKRGLIGMGGRCKSTSTAAFVNSGAVEE